MISFKIKDIEKGQRVDKYLRKNLKDAPLSLLYKLFRKKDVKVNGNRVKGEYILQTGDEVSLYLSEEYLKEYQTKKEKVGLKKTFKVIYEDDHLLIVDKPKGLSVHADEIEHTNTLSNQVLSYLKEKEGNTVVAPAHRLDRNTSGLVIYGKDMETLHYLNELFKSRKGLYKYYEALCFNKLDKAITIDAPLLKDEKEKLVKVNKNGLEAVTVVKPLKVNEKYSLIEAELKTGRTHQIRVHLAYKGYPLVGDQKYGDFNKNKVFEKEYKWNYQFLHAYKIVFGELDGILAYMSNKEIVSPLPKNKQKIVDEIFGGD